MKLPTAFLVSLVVLVADASAGAAPEGRAAAPEGRAAAPEGQVTRVFL